jgi:FtsZ-interacting cell division protein YlmF
MPVRPESVVGRFAEATRQRRPLFRVTVSPGLARFLVAAGAQPALRTDVVAEGLSATPAASADRWREVVMVHRPSGAMRKMAVYLGVVGDDHRAEDQYDDEYDDPDAETGLASITILHPRTYDEARTIGEHFRDGSPLLMDVSEMDDSDAKRIIDFSAGLIFGLRGSIEQVSSKVFLLTPAGAAVEDEEAAVTHESQA